MKWFLYSCVMLLATACIEHTRESLDPALSDLNPTKKTVTTIIPDYKGLKVYQGSVPCADCPIIKQRLALKGDSIGIFRLTETFVDANEDGDEVLVTTGEWRKYDTIIKGNSSSVIYLSEGSIKDSTRVCNYIQRKTQLVQLDIEKKPIPNPGRYTLKLIYEDK